MPHISHMDATSAGPSTSGSRGSFGWAARWLTGGGTTIVEWMNAGCWLLARRAGARSVVVQITLSREACQVTLAANVYAFAWPR